MNKETILAAFSLMFMSASMGFVACFLLMGGFDEPKEETTYQGDTEVQVVVYCTPQEEPKAEPEEIEVVKKTYLGNFKLTGYCPCEKCCGVNTGITATGTKATEGRTIGVNPKSIPYGSIVEINGQQYIAEDTGSAIGKKHIDIFFDTHEDAQAFGVQHADVYLIEEE